MIGDLYNAANVVVGQAAVLVAPAFTPNITPSAAVPLLTDPFSLVPWATTTVSDTGASAGSFTLSFALPDGRVATTASIAYNATAGAVQTAVVAALGPMGGLTSDVVASGGPLPATAVVLSIGEKFQGYTVTGTPVGLTGGTLVVGGPAWRPIGATDQGWTWAAAKTLQDITIEEQSTLVGRFVASQNMTITGALSEDIDETLALVYNFLIAGTAPTATVPGYEVLTLTDNAIQYAVSLIMANQRGYPRWLYIPATTCLANVSTPLRRSAAKRMYTAEFTSVCATNLITVTNITAPHN